MQLIRLFILAIALVAASPLWGWSAHAHIAVGELALQQLSDARTRQINAVAYDIVSELPKDRRLDLMRQYEDTAWLSQLSLLPDRRRDRELGELFADFGLEVPPALSDYADRDTADWHYINQPFSPGSGQSSCDIQNEANVASMLGPLLEAYDQMDSDKGRALVLAFIAHLVADAHQPLHSLSRVDSDCQHDAGGNDFCAADRGMGRCEQNLHQLWDSGVGLIGENQKVAETVKTLSRVEVDEEAVAESDPQAWVKEGASYGTFIYATSVDEAPDETYRQDGQAISAQRLALAAHRLAEILKSL